MELEEREWRLENFGAPGAPTAVGAAAPAITLTFSASGADAGRVAGSGGCNRYFGGYTRAGQTLTIGPVGSTKMMCPDDGVMERESRFFQALAAAQRFEIRDDRLVLICGADELRFVRGA